MDDDLSTEAAAQLGEMSRRVKLISIEPWTPLHRAIKAGDTNYVKGFLDGAFGIDVKPTHVARWLTEARKMDDGPDHNPGDWRMWLKNRVEAAGYFPCHGTSSFSSATGGIARSGPLAFVRCAGRGPWRGHEPEQRSGASARCHPSTATGSRARELLG